MNTIADAVKPHISLKDILMEFTSLNGSVRALTNVSLTVNRGEFISIIGHSGSGKTTLLSIIGGILRPSSGSLFVNGRSVYNEGEAELCRYRAEKIGFIFQSASMFSSLTILENLLFPTQFRKERAKRAGEEEALAYLDMVGLMMKADDYPEQLSGGEARKASLVRALINMPEILLADEPTGDLDDVTEGQVMDLLEKAHRDTGATLVLITHNEELAQRANRQFKMTGGCLNEILWR